MHQSHPITRISNDAAPIGPVPLQTDAGQAQGAESAPAVQGRSAPAPDLPEGLRGRAAANQVAGEPGRQGGEALRPRAAAGLLPPRPVGPTDTMSGAREALSGVRPDSPQVRQPASPAASPSLGPPDLGTLVAQPGDPESAVEMPPSPRSGDERKTADDAERFIPLACDIKARDAAPPEADEDQETSFSFKNGVNAKIPLKSSRATRNAKAGHRTLDALRESGLEVIADLEAALNQPAAPRRHTTGPLRDPAGRLPAVSAAPVVPVVAAMPAMPGLSARWPVRQPGSQASLPRVPVHVPGQRPGGVRVPTVALRRGPPSLHVAEPVLPGLSQPVDEHGQLRDLQAPSRAQEAPRTPQDRQDSIRSISALGLEA